MDIRVFGDVLEQLMYNDTMDIYTSAATTKPDGTTVQTAHGELVHDNVPCKVSFMERDATGGNNAINNVVDRDVLIHVPLRYTLRAGDKVVVTRQFPQDGRTLVITGLCTKPNMFDTHMEVLLEDVGYA